MTAMPNPVWSFFVVIFYSLACIGTGFLLYSVAFDKDRINKNEKSIPLLATTFLLGLGVLANLWLILLCLASFYQTIVIAITVVTASLAGLHFGIQKDYYKNNIKIEWRTFVNEPIEWKLISGTTLSIVLLAGAICFSPLEYNGDAAAYYMVVPKLWNETRSLSLLGGYESFMTIGLHGELHFAALMMMGTQWYAKFITWPVAIACSVFLIGITRQTSEISSKGKWITVLLLFTSTAFVLLIGDGKTDLFSAAFGCAAFYWLNISAKSLAKSKYVLVGIFAGLSIIAKLSYLPTMIVGIFVLTLWMHYSNSNEKQGLDNEINNSLLYKYTWIAIGLFLPFAPHFIKNWILFSEPLAPFLYFGENPFADGWTNQTWFSQEIIRRILLTYPLALVYGKYPMQYGNISVLMLAFCPLIVVGVRYRNVLRSKLFQLTATALMTITLWKILRPGVFAPRYYLCFLLLLIPAIAALTDRTMRLEKPPKLLGFVITGVCICYLLGFNGILATKIVKRFASNPNRIAIENASGYLNSHIKRNERVFSYNYFTYWLSPKILRTLSTSNEKQKATNIKISQDLWEYFHDRNFKYILIDQALHPEQAESILSLHLQRWKQSDLVYNQNGFSIIKLF
jgi:hypothetical protein